MDMPITSIMRDWGTNPSIVRISSTDTLSDVTVTDYILSQENVISELNNGPFEWVVGDLVAVAANDGSNFFCFNGDDFHTLIDLPGGGGGIDLPTTVNHIAVYTDTAGTLSENASPAINAGVIQSGLANGDSGSGFIAYPTGAPNMGRLIIFPSSNLGDFSTIIQPEPMGQTTTIQIADPASFFGRILIAGGFSPFVVGNFPEVDSTNGRMIDSGVSVASLAAATDPVGKITYLDVNINASDLAAGAYFPAVIGVGGNSYQIRNFMVNVSTGFSGGGGDRDIILTDPIIFVNILTIQAALIGTPVNTLWGSTGILFGSAAQNNPTVPGAGFGFKYSGGTTDYDTGTINVTIAYTLSSV